MNVITKTIRPFLACCLLAPTVHGQSPAPQDPAFDTAVGFYHAYLTPETHLYRGPEYVAYVQLLKSGYPYFGENSRRKGTVFYDGVGYKNVYLYYDLVTGQVVINDVYNVFKIALINELIDSFSIEDHFFIHLRDSLNPTAPRNGYYELLYTGRNRSGLQLLKKEKKVIQEDLTQGEHAVRFIDGADSSYYLKIGNTYHPVNNKRSLANTLKDKSKDLRKFLRTQKLSMRKEKEITLLKVAAWYDSLTH